MIRIPTIIVTVPATLISVSTFAQGKTLMREELASGLLLKMAPTFTRSMEEMSADQKSDVVFGVEVGGLRVSFEAEEVICDLLVPDYKGWTLNYNQAEKSGDGQVLVIARQYPGGLMLGDQNITLQRNAEVLGVLATVPTNSKIESSKDFGYELVLVRTTLPQPLKPLTAASLRCK